jgi:hypothetical protein
MAGVDEGGRDPLFSHRTIRYLFYGWSVILLVAVAVLAVRQNGEPQRTTRQLQVDCAFYGDIAKVPLPANASELGRRIVRDAADSYDKRGCERISGPLPTPPPPTPDAGP